MWVKIFGGNVAVLTNVRKKGYRTCSKCGQTAPKGNAHNARTCNKNSPPNQTLTPPQKTAQRGLGGDVKGVGGVTWETHIENLPTTDSGEEKDAVEEYTLEELETLWILQNGNTGKLGKEKSKHGKNPVWTEQDTENLKTFVNHVYEIFPNFNEKTWAQFFKTFGAEAKRSMIWNHLECEKIPRTPEETFYPMRRWGREGVVSAKLFKIFSTDTSLGVRRLVAMKEGLPETVQNKLAQNSDSLVLKNLASRSDASEETLRQIYVSVKKEMIKADRLTTSDQRFNKKQPYYHVLSTIAKNPNAPHDIILELGKNESSLVREAAYSNTGFPVETKHDIYRKLSREMTRMDERLNELGTLPDHLYHTNETHRQMRKLKTEKESVENELRRLTIAGGCPSVEKLEKVTEEEIGKMMYSYNLDRKNSTGGGAKWIPLNVSKLLTYNQYSADKIQHFYDETGGVEGAPEDFISFLLTQKNVPPHIVHHCEENPPWAPSPLYTNALKLALERIGSSR